MSFSFNLKLTNKADLKEAIKTEMNAVVASQPFHAPDAPIITAAAEAAIDRLATDESKDVEASISGSVIFWEKENNQADYSDISFNVYVRVVPRYEAFSDGIQDVRKDVKA